MMRKHTATFDEAEGNAAQHNDANLFTDDAAF